MAPKGRLLCSGIHTRAEAQRVLRAARAQGLRHTGSATLHDWYRLDFCQA
jgi:ribosomal protein L11 methylase PrmA